MNCRFDFACKQLARQLRIGYYCSHKKIWQRISLFNWQPTEIDTEHEVFAKEYHLRMFHGAFPVWSSLELLEQHNKIPVHCDGCVIHLGMVWLYVHLRKQSQCKFIHFGYIGFNILVIKIRALLDYTIFQESLVQPSSYTWACLSIPDC